MLNCFKDHEKCFHILYLIFNFVQQRTTIFTMVQVYILPILHGQYISCWCPGELSQGISGPGIDPAKPECSASSIRRVKILKNTSTLLCPDWYSWCPVTYRPSAASGQWGPRYTQWGRINRTKEWYSWCPVTYHPSAANGQWGPRYTQWGRINRTRESRQEWTAHSSQTRFWKKKNEQDVNKWSIYRWFSARLQYLQRRYCSLALSHWYIQKGISPGADTI